jgi:hypothetical protein
VPAVPIPHDTSLDARRTAARLGVEPPPLGEQLRRLRAQVDNGRLEEVPAGAGGKR